MFGFVKKKPEIPDFLQVPWTIRDLVFFVLGWMGSLAAILLLIGLLAPYVPWLGSFYEAAKNNDINANFVINLLDAVVGFGLIWLYLRRYHVGLSALGWRRTSLIRSVGYLLGILVIFVIVSSLVLTLVSVLVPGFDADQAQQNEFIGDAQTHRSLALVALVLLPPILEETIFRGFLFPALAKRLGVVGGAIVSAAIFGIAHWQANISVYTFVLGLLLCFMYVRLRSIVPGIVLHMANNYLAFLALSGK